MSTPHTSFKRGTHVFVILNDGTSFDDNYIEKKRSGFVILKNHGRISVSNIRSMSFYKNKTDDKGDTDG